MAKQDPPEKKYWELKLIMATDDASIRTPVWCMHYPIPCEDCDLKSRCLTVREPSFTWKELGDAGTSCLTREDLEKLADAVRDNQQA
ncbi:MAG: hypothetical protein ABIB93_01680 [Chloroflexota bacterium]